MSFSRDVRDVGGFADCNGGQSVSAGGELSKGSWLYQDGFAPCILFPQLYVENADRSILAVERSLY